MQLSRQEIERWFKNSGANIKGGTGGGGGGQNVDLSSYAQKSWVEEGYVSKSFFNELFVINGLQKVETSTDGGTTWTLVGQATAITFAPNEVPSVTTEENPTTHVLTRTTRTITDIKVLAGLWTDSYLSALGQNSSGGGGGGGSTTLAGLLDVTLNNPSNGQALVYDSSLGKWTNATIQQSGGTVTSITAGTGLSGGTITGSGTIAIDSSYQSYISHGESAYQWIQNNPLSNYLPLTGGTMSGGIYLANTNAVLTFGSLTASPITGYNLPPIGSNGVAIFSRYGNSTDEGGIILSEDTCVIYNSFDTGWGFQVHDKDLIQEQTLGDITRVFGIDQANHAAWSLGGYVKDGSSDQHVLLGGGGHKLESELCVYSATKLATARTLWGQPFDGTANVSGSIEAGNNGGAIEGFHAIELNTHGTLSGYGGYIEFHYNGSSADFTSRILEDASGRLNINGVLLQSNYVTASRYYLSSSIYFELDANNHVHLVGAGFYTDSFVSALGLNSSGGGGGGSSTLAGLNDVQLGTLSADDILTYDGTGHWINTSKSSFLSGYLTSVAFSDLTSHPTTLYGYGITDAYISGGTIYLGSNSITPLTSFTETDPTVPSWAKQPTKPSYSFGELTSHPTTLSGYGITDATFGTAGSDYIPITLGSTTQNVLTSHQSVTGSFWGQSWSNGGTVTGSLSSVVSITMSGDIQMDNNTSIRIKPNGGDGQYWNVLTMNTGNTLALGYYTRTHGQDTDIQGGTITFAVNGGSGTASSAVENRVDAMTIDENGRVWIKIAAQGLRIGDGLITWDSQNNALKIQRISSGSVVDGGLYATSFLSALGANSGSGGGGGGDVTWTALADGNDTRAIAFSHMSNTLSNANVNVNSLSIQGECFIYDDGGDLALSATYGDVFIDDDCTIVGTTWIGSTLGVNSLATFNGSIVVKYDGATRFSFSTPYYNVHLLTIDAAGTFTDSVSAPSFINTSDERKKNIVDHNATLTVDQVANAPAVHFTWKDSADTSTHVGTLAQYWRDICPEAVPENYDGFYGVDYAVLAMLSSISIARRIQELEQEIEQLKKAL